MKTSAALPYRDDEISNLLRRAEVLVENRNIEGLKDLQRIVWRQLQSRFMLQPYLVSDHSSWDPIWLYDFTFECLEPSVSDLYSIIDSAYVDLSSDPVITSPWHPQRITRNLGMIGDGMPCGPFEESSNHSASYCWPLNVALVTGGNHSIAQGILRGQGRVKVEECYDFTPIIEQVFFDGIEWALICSGQKLGQPRFKEIGWAWELGRILMRHSTLELRQTV
ncbi:DUF6710 family protein [Grimontia hollisae]|uniref:DUF6710 family protein n=1 Tax=Grimontia hollisae TaxID=673 RepID=UPI001303B078|nr:DUF6710 family protein [Grimontia hollisae]